MQVERLAAKLASVIESVCFEDAVNDVDGMTDDVEKALDIIEGGFWGCVRAVIADVVSRIEDAIAENEQVRRQRFEEALREHFLQKLRKLADGGG